VCKYIIFTYTQIHMLSFMRRSTTQQLLQAAPTRRFVFAKCATICHICHNSAEYKSIRT